MNEKESEAMSEEGGWKVRMWSVVFDRIHKNRILFLSNPTFGKLVGKVPILVKSTLQLSFTIAEMFGVDPSLVATMAANLYASKATWFAIFRSSSVAEYTFC